MKISEVLKKKATISFEVFPPKIKMGIFPLFIIPLKDWRSFRRILSVLHTGPAAPAEGRRWKSRLPSNTVMELSLWLI